MDIHDMTFHKVNKNPADKLLELIEEGDADTILSETNMQNSITELLKYELIVIKNDKVYLTELGRVARIVGVQKVISELKEKKSIMKSTAPVADQRDLKSSYVSYYILLLVGLLMILLIQVL